ncbi:MAG TPA: phosphate ABC transporter permease subunit PstC [Gemmataceae bacterium]|nr:phosphate ABC transporter permease subunit PstC [Gemmataceae bacterium]
MSTASPPARFRDAVARHFDTAFGLACRASGLLVLFLVLGLAALLVQQSWPVLSRAGEYELFTTTEWNPPRKVKYLVGPDGGERPYAPESDPAFVVAEESGLKVVSDAATGHRLAVREDDDGRLMLTDTVTRRPIGQVVEKPRPRFGIWVFVYGTLATSAIAMVVAVPLGVGTAAFLSEIAPGWLRRACSFLSELLAAIPSVVFGFWGLFFIAPVLDSIFKAVGITSAASGQGILSAGLILAIMILPYITAISFDVCRAVPTAQRQGALALGATRWQMIRTVVLPYARPGILAACFLALGRALGETMAVTMLIGNVRYLPKWPTGLGEFGDEILAGRGDSIASVIAGQLHEAEGPTRSALIALGLILFVITALTNIAGRSLIGLAGRSGGRARLLKTQAEEPPPPPPEALDRTRRAAERRNNVMTWVLAGCQLLTIVPLFLIIGYIVYRGAPEVSRNLFLERPAPMGETGGGLGHAMLGSLYMVSIASLIAIPVGILAAVFLSEYKTSPLAHPVRFVTELLGGVPSIVIGIFAYSVVINPPWASRSGTFSAWAGIFALGVMMLPVVVRATEEALKLVPGSLRQASYALGASQAQTVLRVLIPAALPAIITGVLLAMGRIAGETAPLLLTARDSRYWPGSLGEKMASLPYYIYDYSRYPPGEEQRLAWGGAMVLLSFVVVLNVGIRLLAGKRLVSASRAD